MKRNAFFFSLALVASLLLPLTSQATLPPAVLVFLIAAAQDSSGPHQYFNFHDVVGTHTESYATAEGSGSATGTITGGADPVLQTKVILNTVTPGVQGVDALVQLDYYFQVNGPPGNVNVPLNFVGNLDYPNPLPSNAGGRRMEANVLLIDFIGTTTNLAYVYNIATPPIKLPASGVPGGNLNQTVTVAANSIYRFRLSVETSAINETATYEMTLDPLVTIDAAFAATHPGYTLEFSPGFEPSTNVVETVRPTLSMTNVATGLQVSNAAFTVKGTAADDVAVTNAFYSLNDGGWNGAGTGNGWTNWAAGLNLTPGTNTIAAYAVDSSGNVSLTNTVQLIYVASDTLTVSTNGRGKVSPNYNHAALQIGTRYTMTAVPAAGFAFINWTDGLGNPLTNKPTLKFTMTPNLTLVANFRDATRPTAIITSPTASLHPASALLTVTGKARDNVAVSNILVGINGAWTTATSTNLGSNWIAQVTLVPGTNTLSACAVDTSGNVSLTNKVKLKYILMDRPTVQIVGPGSVTPNYNGKSLVISNRYSLKATPAKGSVFSSWDVRGVLTTNAALTFTMSSNLTITATCTDVTRPVNVITFPLVNQKWSNAVLTVTGKAGDNVGVSNVWCQINNGGWVLAGSTNSFAKWNAANLTVLSGTNLVQVFAEDAAGNISLTNALKFLGFPP